MNMCFSIFPFLSRKNTVVYRTSEATDIFSPSKQIAKAAVWNIYYRIIYASLVKKLQIVS